VRRGPGTPIRRLRTLQFALTRDREAIVDFLRRGPGPLSLRLRLLERIRHVSDHVRGYHGNDEILAVGAEILRRPGATVVECGAGPGGSTVKLSHFVAAVQGRLLVFDSFRGMPENQEVVQHLDGRPMRYRPGAFVGRIGAVRRALARHGVPEVCTLVKGDFADTLAEPVVCDVAFLDVDLVASTRRCLAGLRLRPGGVLFSQDGHIKQVVELLSTAGTWPGGMPVIPGLGRAKLLRWYAV